jgi:hypothetical protein
VNAIDDDMELSGLLSGETVQYEDEELKQGTLSTRDGL